MVARWLTYLSFLCFGLLGLMVLQMTKRPLCIDSRVVERIDRLSAPGTETIYRCAFNKVTPFSPYFNKQLPDLSYRVQQMERVLEGIEPFEHKVQITVFEDRPYLFRIQDHQIYIGTKLLEASGHLEKALSKVWYRERSTVLFAQQDLMEEIATDFLVYLVTGDLNVGDPDTEIKTAIQKVKWPYAVKSVKGYCESPWKRSEHYSPCLDMSEFDSTLEEQTHEMSLRPLLTASWIRAYKELSGKERFNFVQTFPLFLRSNRPPEIPVTDLKAECRVEESVLLKMAEAIKRINSYISASNALKESAVFRSFVANFAIELQSIGFQDAAVEVSFDVLYVSQEPLNEKSEIFQQFMKVAENNSKLQIVIRDAANLWMLPIKNPYPAKSFGKIKAKRTIVEKCGSYDFTYVMDYAELAEKLLVVENCENKHLIQYSRYLDQGAEGFGTQNAGITFVQFHLPSLLMKKSELRQVPNVFEFIQKRDVENSSFRSLGWQELRWSKQANAYQPKAFVDAIEWFRVIN